MYARLEKLGLGHKKHNPDLLTEDTEGNCKRCKLSVRALKEIEIAIRLCRWCEEEIEKFCLLDIDPDTITWKRVTDCSVLDLDFQHSDCFGS